MGVTGTGSVGVVDSVVGADAVCLECPSRWYDSVSFLRSLDTKLCFRPVDAVPPLVAVSEPDDFSRCVDMTVPIQKFI